MPPSTLLHRIGRAFQEIMRQRTLEQLCPTLLGIAVDLAKAQSGHLLLAQADNHELRLAAEMPGSGGEFDLRGRDAGARDLSRLPAYVLDHLRDLGESPDMAKAPPHAFLAERTPFGEAIRSVLYLPMTRQGNRVGALYLASRHAPDACTSEELEALHFIATQSATCIERIEYEMHLLAENSQFSEITRALAMQRNLLYTLAESVPHRIYAKDTETRFIFGNTSVARGMGVACGSDLLGKTDSNFYPPEDAAKYYREEQAIMQSGQPLLDHEERVAYTLTDDVKWLLTSKVPLRDAQGQVIGIVGINYDITERKRMEMQLKEHNEELLTLNNRLKQAQEQLMQSEKLASIGQLAAGVAHEINNPMAYIFSNFNVLDGYLKNLFEMLSAYEKTTRRTDMPEEEGKLIALHESLDIGYLESEIPALMKESREGITRVRTIVQNLKDFSRVDHAQKREWANLHDGIDATLNIINSEIKYKADVVKEYGRIPGVECLPGQINQVIMNLLINAAHAMGEDRGTIFIRTGLQDDTVWIEIRDTGSGIPKENLSRIFDPFFTTKPVGKGTGLGLSLSYGIMQEHRGSISVESEIGKGTIFRLTLPVERKEDENPGVAEIGPAVRP